MKHALPNWYEPLKRKYPIVTAVSLIIKLQLFTGNLLNDQMSDKNNIIISALEGFCAIE